MNIATAFDINLTEYELICFVGAGGKTTTMFKLAHKLKHLHKKVLVTTTTNIYRPDESNCDRVIIYDSPDMEIFDEIPIGSVTVLGREITSENKLVGVDKEFIEDLHNRNLFDYILVEGDGSKRKSIKAPAHYEPIVPDNSTKTIGVIGLDAVGKPITEDYVHRSELFCTVVQRQPGEILDEEAVISLIVSSQGLFKGVPDGCKKYVVLNKAEKAQRKVYAGNILLGLLKRDTVPITICIIAAMAHSRIY